MVAARRPAPRTRWAPDRRDIIWIDCNAQIGREMHDVHPFLVLSPRAFNEKTSLVIGLPMTTAEYNSDSPFTVAVGGASKAKSAPTSYVLCHQPKSFDSRLRKGKRHPLGVISSASFRQVCERLNQVTKIG